MAGARNLKSSEYDRRYTVKYGADANAALQPQYIPYPEQEPERRPQRRPKALPPVRPQARTQHKKKGAKALLVMGVIITAAMAFAVVMRNSQIYENNRSIQSAGQSISQATQELNTARQQLSAKEDIDSYIKYAQDELNMTFPEEGTYIVINPEINTGAQDLTETQKNDNIIDRFLDWLNSLERRA